MPHPKISDEFPHLRFERPWRLTTGAGEGDPLRRVTYDEQLLEQVIRGDSGPAVCIKRESRCLVTTRRESRMAGFEEACQVLAGQGWPVVVRCSGGTCVPQGAGVINLSVVHRTWRGWLLEDGYRLLCRLLTRYLADYGLTAEVGEVPGAFCDGRYNLQVGGRKLVGTAQRWAGGSRDRATVLAHACVLVDLDLDEATDRVNTLYRMCGSQRRFSPTSCTTLRECVDPSRRQPEETFLAEAEQRLTTLVKEYFEIS